jgi:hypothetical protein
MAKTRQSQTNHHASVYDFKDTDLMLKLAAAGGSGISAADLAEDLGWTDHDGVRAIGMRFAWMKRYGMLDYDDKHHLWVLSAGGERVMAAQKAAATMPFIEQVPDESMVEVMAHVTSRYRHAQNSKDALVAHLLRREFMYGTSPRSTVWGRR